MVKLLALKWLRFALWDLFTWGLYGTSGSAVSQQRTPACPLQCFVYYTTFFHNSYSGSSAFSAFCIATREYL